MAYFTDFPVTAYRFGNELNANIFPDLSTYVSILDLIKDSVSFYNSYYIQDGERPDQVAYKLYRDPNLHWTFYFMNDSIRERGWPLSNREILAQVDKDFTHNVLVTRTPLAGKFKVGQTIEGTNSSATATIKHRNLDLGQLTLDDVSGTFTNNETIESTNADGFLETIVSQSYSSEALAVHHYENDAGEWVDIDPTVGPGALYTAITNTDRYIALNDELKQIRVIKPSAILDVVDAFKEALKA